MDDTLVAEIFTRDGRWVSTVYPGQNSKLRVSIATVEGKPVFEGDTYYRHGDSFIARATYTYDYGWWKDCTLTPPKPKSVLDGKEFNELTFYSHEKTVEKLKEFILTHFEEKK
jgi:hypothetical protein